MKHISCLTSAASCGRCAVNATRILDTPFPSPDRPSIQISVSQGALLEPQLGSLPYAALLLELLVLSHGMILPVTRAVAAVAPSFSDVYYRCALLLTLKTHVRLDWSAPCFGPRASTCVARLPHAVIAKAIIAVVLHRKQTLTPDCLRAQGVRRRLFGGPVCSQGRP